MPTNAEVALVMNNVETKLIGCPCPFVQSSEEYCHSIGALVDFLHHAQLLSFLLKIESIFRIGVLLDADSVCPDTNSSSAERRCFNASFKLGGICTYEAGFP